MKNRYNHKAEKPSGALVYEAVERKGDIRIDFIEYNAEEMHEYEHVTEVVRENLRKDHLIGWLNIEGLGNIEMIEKIGECFDLHGLLLEDVLNTNHRPKSEEFDEYLFISLKMLSVNEIEDEVISEQVSIVLGSSWLISFQEQEGDIFDPIRDRLRTKKGKTREKGADFLFYRLIDSIVDNYYLVSEFYDHKINDFEDKIIESSEASLLEELQFLRRQVINLGRDIYPLREAIGNLVKDDYDQIGESVRPYLKDVYDHVIQLHETIEIQRESLYGLADLYHTSVGQKTNQIMQTLTVVATIFIPLTFIVGIYGMNFDNMPELHWKYGYFLTWGVMIVIVLLMFVYFRRKKWW